MQEISGRIGPGEVAQLARLLLIECEDLSLHPQPLGKKWAYQCLHVISELGRQKQADL